MAVEQYRDGSITVVTGSIVVDGSGTSWANGNIREGHKFKVKEEGRQSYTVATILSNTKLQLTTTFKEASVYSASYLITRSFTPYRNYARTYQGDYHAADIIRDQIVNPIDTDVGKIYSGSASLDGTRVVNGVNYWDIEVNASGEMQFKFKGTKKAYIATPTGAWTTV